MPDQPVLQTKDGEEIIKTPSKKGKRTRRIIKNFLFFFFWLYLLIRLFITDIDLLLATRLGIQNSRLFISLRFISLLIIFFLIWIYIGNKRFWKNVGLFVLFPIYPGGWIFVQGICGNLPEFLLAKNLHFTLYSYIELIINFIFEFKRTMLKILVFILAFIVLFNLNSYWLLISIVIFSFLQISHIIKRFRQTFEPIKVFRIKIDTGDMEKDHPLLMGSIEKQFQKIERDKKLGNEEKTFKQIEHVLMISEVANTLSLEIKNILTNRTYFKAFFWKILFSLLISMIFFGGINYALYRFNPSNYNVDHNPSFFNFFYYSFFTIIPGATDISAASTVAKFVKMAGVSIGIIINLLILTFYITVANDKYKEKLSKLINYADQYSVDVKDFFKKKYGYDPSEYVEKVKKQGTNFKTMMDFLGMLFRKKK
jgi:hypothetical protein